MPALSPRQRRHLRALGQSLRPVVHVGAAGLTTELAAALDEALASHELVKVRMHQPEDKKALAAALARAAQAELCGQVGHTALLWRRHPERPRIELPDEEQA